MIPSDGRAYGVIEGFIHRRGRKFFLALWISTLATLVALVGIGAMQANPAVAPFIAGILTALAAVFSIVASMFGIADAAITRSAIAAGLHDVPLTKPPTPRSSAAVTAPGDL